MCFIFKLVLPVCVELSEPEKQIVKFWILMGDVGFLPLELNELLYLFLYLETSLNCVFLRHKIKFLSFPHL